MELPDGYELITTEAQLDDLCSKLLEADIIAVDTETEGLEFNDIIVGIALSHKEGNGYYIPIRHEMLEGVLYPNQVPADRVYEKLKPILETKVCVGHNVKFDLKMFWKDGININYKHDTLIMAHVLHVEHDRSKSLKKLTKGIFGHEMHEIDSLFPKVGRKKPKIEPKILSPDDIAFYGCEDGNWSMKLFNYLSAQLSANQSVSLVYNIEMSLVKVVAEMESFGIPASMEFLQSSSKTALRYIGMLQNEILSTIRSDLNDPEFDINLGSSQQLADLLFNKLGLPVIATSKKTGKPSADAAVMKELAKTYPLCQQIVTLRELSKLNNTYLSGLQASVDTDGRIRGSFNQVGTASGRFSSSKPNLQNLPKDQTFIIRPVTTGDPEFSGVLQEFGPDLVRLQDGVVQVLSDETGVWGDHFIGTASDGRQYTANNGKLFEVWKCKTRSFIEASESHYLIEADYSQVELRIMAGESREPNLIDAFNTGQDVHSRTSSLIFDVPFEHVTKEQRHIGKTINFSLLYGAGAFNISKQLGVDVDTAQGYIDKYFENLHSIKSWINAVKRSTRMDSYAETVLLRKRLFPNAKSSDHRLAEKELRESVNHVIQGTAADVMKIALVRTSNNMRKHFGDKVKIISTVHDSLLVECHESCPVDQVVSVLKHSMEGIREFLKSRLGTFTGMDTWPYLEIDTKVGKSWGESKDYTLTKLVSVDQLPVVDNVNQILTRQVAQERLQQQTGNDAVTWILSIHGSPTPHQIAQVNLRLAELRSDADGDFVNIEIHRDDDGPEVFEGTGKYNFGPNQALFFRSLGLQCTVSQSMESFNVKDVIKDVDYGDLLDEGN